jgi:putative spermidine/putrescine transport system permease protein
VTTPVLYALGTVTTLFSFSIILLALAIILVMRRRQAKVV